MPNRTVCESLENVCSVPLKKHITICHIFGALALCGPTRCGHNVFPPSYAWKYILTAAIVASVVFDNVLFVTARLPCASSDVYLQ